MLGKIALEEAWTFPPALAHYDVSQLAPQKGVIGDDLVANLLDIAQQPGETRLSQMDENGVELMVLSLSSPGPQGVPDPAEAAELARTANDALAAEMERAGRRGGRFRGLISVSMHSPEAAAGEVMRWFGAGDGDGNDTTAGKEGGLFVGVIVNDFQSRFGGGGGGEDGNKTAVAEMGFYDGYDAETGTGEFDPFWKVVEELDVPVYLHPREATPAVHDMMWKGRPWLAYSALGYAQRVGMHALGIVTSGVLDRFRGVKIVLGHMGEHIPYDLYRIDHKLNRARFPDMPMAKDKLVRDYFGTQLFITTSGHFSTPALLCAMQEIGARSIMFAIDYPFESIPNACVWFDDHVPISNMDLVDIGRNNALRVFKRLGEGIDGLKEKSPLECGVGGLKGVEYGLYNRNWSKRLERGEA